MFTRIMSAPDEPFFSIIYSAAITKNVSAINEVLKRVGIDVYNANFETPVERLAAERNTDAVAFLVVNFNPSPLAIIAGWARAGNLGQVNNILKVCKDKNQKFALLQQAFYGFARGNYVHELESYLLAFQMADNSEDQVFRLLIYAMLGFTLSNNIVAQKDMQDLVQDKARKFQLKLEMAFGLGVSRNMFRIIPLMAEQYTDVQQKQIATQIVFGLAQSNSIDELNQLMRGVKIFIRDELLIAIGNGLAKIGMSTQAYSVLSKIKDENRIRLLYALMQGFYQGKYFSDAFKVFIFTRDRNERLIVLNHIATEFEVGNYSLKAFEFLKKTNDEEEQKILLNIVIDYYFSVKNVQKIEKMLREAINEVYFTTISKKLIMHYAQTRNIPKVDSILKSSRNDKQLAEFLEYMFMGFITLGSHNLISRYIKTVTDPQKHLLALAQVVSCHIRMKLFKNIDELVELANVDEVVIVKKQIVDECFAIKQPHHLFMMLLKTDFEGKIHDEVVLEYAVYKFVKEDHLYVLNNLLMVSPTTTRKQLIPTIIKGFLDSDKLNDALDFIMEKEYPIEQSDYYREILLQLGEKGDFKSFNRIISTIIIDADNRKTLIALLDKRLYKSIHFSSNNNAIKSLAQIENKDARNLIENEWREAKRDGENASAFVSVVVKAEKLRELLASEAVSSIDQGLDWLSLEHETLVFLSYYIKEKGLFEPKIGLMVASYLSPILLEDKGKELANKLTYRFLLFKNQALYSDKVEQNHIAHLLDDNEAHHHIVKP